MLNKLPEDIKNNIILFSIKKQKKELLEDIINFYENKIILFNNYQNNAYFTVTLEDEIINDLFKYTNNNKNTIDGFHDKFYEIWSRLYGLYDNTLINNYIKNLEYKSYYTQINCFFAILLPEERKEFLQKNIEI
jgi:hypothetical protein